MSKKENIQNEFSKPFMPELFDESFIYNVAMPYHYHGEFNSRASEFNIQFYASRNDIKDLAAFCRAYSDRNVNVWFVGGIDRDMVLTMHKMFDNFYVRIDITDIESIKFLQENKIRFFMDSSFPANSYGQLEAMLRMGVESVYISDDLCYNLSSVSQTCHDANVRLRCELNRLPSTALDASTNPKTIVWTPQDMNELNGYFDVFEFALGQDPIDWHKFKVLFNTYFVKRKWHGNLNEIIEGLEFDYDDDFIMPTFPSYKYNCGKRCVMREGNKCQRCQRYLTDMQRIMHDKKIFFKVDANNKENNG